MQAMIWLSQLPHISITVGGAWKMLHVLKNVLSFISNVFR